MDSVNDTINSGGRKCKHIFDHQGWLQNPGKIHRSLILMMTFDDENHIETKETLDNLENGISVWHNLCAIFFYWKTVISVIWLCYPSFCAQALLSNMYFHFPPPVTGSVDSQKEKPKIYFPGRHSMKTSQITMFLHSATRVWGQHWHT